MSNVYNLEPPTKGKVILHTTLGDLDIELWPKEAPKAVRNFVQLCLEGYYDGTIFHRIMANYMAQGGDPTGTGTGGESIYGDLFKDEFHQRLKFTHRGLVACANQNQPHTNGSQFFITLDKCDWLDKKNTIFGKVVGDTIYNLTRFNEVDVDAETDRPHEPPRITSAEVLANPFEDIVPRIRRPAPAPPVAAEAAAKEARGSKRPGSTAVAGSAKSSAPGKSKNLALLSFGEQAEEEEEEVVRLPKKIRAAHDVLADDRLVRAEDTPAEDRIDVEALKAEAEQRRQAAERARAALSKHKAAEGGKEAGPGGGEDRGAEQEGSGGDEDEDGRRFAERMRAQVQGRRKALGDHTVAEDREDKATRAPAAKAKSEDSGSDSGEDGRRGGRRRGSGDAGEQYDLDTIRREKRAYGKMHAGGIEVADADLLKPWQVSREKYKQRRQRIGHREQDTLARLNAFSSKLHTVAATASHPQAAAAQPAKTERPSVKAESAVKTERPQEEKEEDRGYDGKVRTDIDHNTYMPAAWRVEDYLEGDFMDASLEALRQHTLSFAQAPGRPEDKGPDSMDDYVVYDPLLEKAKGKFSKAAQKEKKRRNEWAGKSNN